MNYQEQLNKSIKRNEQLDSKKITAIFKLINDNFKDTELALTVSLQLKRQNEFLRLQKREHEDRFKTLSTKLREIADIVAEIDDNSTYY